MDSKFVAFLLILPFCVGKPSITDNFPAPPLKPTPTERYGRVYQLDSHGNYWLFWKTNDTHITFETHVKTKGYVGFGLSSNGKMFPSDVVVGWVDSNGQTHFKDCHTTGHFTPIIDSSQDYSLILGKEDDFGTVLKFTRKLDTCDDNDFHITDSTIKVIWSYHPDDPSSFSTLSWHGTDRRGAKSLMFLSAPSYNNYVPPSDAVIYDMLHDQFHLPSSDTTYQCRVFKVPHLTQKHHMIRYEPIITPGNEDVVHHVLVYNCPTATDKDDGSVFNCYGRRPKHMSSCSDIILAWAVGGGAFDFPANAGFSFGAAGDPVYLLMETHYNNPTMKSGIIDSSGFRITATPTIRQYDSGILATGAPVNKLQFIPPHEKAFESKHYCNKECINRALQSQSNSIKVFGVVLHAHLLGVGMKARHIRGDVELPPLAADDAYDFNYQEMRVLQEEREIKYGDSVTVECTYDSTGRTKPTLGGLPTTAEMCLAFLFYYPRVPITTCYSEPLYSQLGRDPFHNSDTLSTWNWNDKAVREKFQGILDNTMYYHYCAGYNNPANKNYTLDVFGIREPRTKYTTPARQCPSQ